MYDRSVILHKRFRTGRRIVSGSSYCSFKSETIQQDVPRCADNSVFQTGRDLTVNDQLVVRENKNGIEFSMYSMIMRTSSVGAALSAAGSAHTKSRRAGRITHDYDDYFL